MRHDPRMVLENIAEHGWGRVTPAQMLDVIDYIKGFGLGHLTRDPDMHEIWEKLLEADPHNGWSAIHSADISLFAMVILDETRR